MATSDKSEGVVTTRSTAKASSDDTNARPLPDVLRKAKEADLERQTFSDQRDVSTATATLDGGTKVRAESHVIDRVKG